MVPASPLRSLFVFGLLGIGAAALWATRPRFSSREVAGEAQSASCLSNLRQISRAYALYARDFDNKIPLAVDPEDRFNNNLWTSETTANTPFGTYLQKAPFLHLALRPYVASPQVFRCPSDAGWSVSRLAQTDYSGDTIGLKNVRPSSFAKYGTSYYSWTIYGFNLLTLTDVPQPERKSILFDGDTWHERGKQMRSGELFLDGHAALLTREEHDKAAPNRD